MKTAIVRLVISSVLLASVASGQWLETTIYLPDSLNSLTAPDFLEYNSTDNTIYVSGNAFQIVAIDGETNQKTAWIEVGRSPRSLEERGDVTRIS